MVEKWKPEQERAGGRGLWLCGHGGSGSESNWDLQVSTGCWWVWGTAASEHSR